jgi:two-component system, sensor histidine kinase and response regulator
MIIDAHLPGMNTMALKDRIRQMPRHARTPIFITTSLKAVVTGEDDLTLGFDGALSKPVKLGDLKAVIDQVANPSRAGGPIHGAVSSPGVSRSPEINRQPIHRGHILVADDYPVNQQVAYMHLTAVGYTVELVENGQQAVEAFDHRTYDLIFMDMQMPILNGLDATGRIRELEAARGRPRRTPIVALTANAMQGDERRCLDAGMDEYLVKPIHRHQLITTAHRWIDAPGEGGKSRLPTPPAATDPLKVDAAVMDMATAIEEFGDPGTVKTLARQLIDTVVNRLPTIRDAIAADDRECIRKEAHSIKGGAATLEAGALSAAAAHLEEISRNATSAGLNAGYHDLENQFFLLKAFMAKWKGR